MNLFRVVFLIAALGTVAGAGYLSYFGVWRDSTDLDRSVRLGSPGGGGINGRVK
ncbi:spermidine synthase [Oceanicola sp. 22II-s10i]|uniref:hypothetical protein n=1 Tax=Oceanicola sp. 22II-s10i TaxID=1317116 RepID=UPI000B678E36|nr:hypothetical protein [Oceanicola sp. 22II-s10i]OWU86107.1 spermidine synthase [Oceanicola sp. 22II-s10i]